MTEVELSVAKNHQLGSLEMRVEMNILFRRVYKWSVRTTVA